MISALGFGLLSSFKKSSIAPHRFHLHLLNFWVMVDVAQVG